MRSLYFLLLAFAKQVQSTSSGYDIWTCLPSQHNTPFKVTGSSAPYFALRALAPDGTIVPSLQPGLSQTVELYSLISTAKIAGIITAPFTGSQITCPKSCSTVTGSFTAIANLRAMSSCLGGLTQTSKQSSTSIKFIFTPVTGPSSITIWAIVVGSGDTYAVISAIFPLSLSPLPPLPSPLSNSFTTTPTPSLINSTVILPSNSDTSTITISPGGRRSSSSSRTPTVSSTNTASSTNTLLQSVSVSPTPSQSIIVYSNIFLGNSIISPIANERSNLNIAAISISAVIIFSGILYLCYYALKKNYNRKLNFSNKAIETTVVLNPFQN